MDPCVLIVPGCEKFRFTDLPLGRERNLPVQSEASPRRVRFRYAERKTSRLVRSRLKAKNITLIGAHRVIREIQLNVPTVVVGGEFNRDANPSRILRWKQ